MGVVSRITTASRCTGDCRILCQIQKCKVFRLLIILWALASTYNSLSIELIWAYRAKCISNYSRDSDEEEKTEPHHALHILSTHTVEHYSLTG